MFYNYHFLYTFIHKYFIISNVNTNAIHILSYAFLNAILNIYNADKIITGHHLDDKIETFFFNLVR